MTKKLQSEGMSCIVYCLLIKKRWISRNSINMFDQANEVYSKDPWFMLPHSKHIEIMNDIKIPVLICDYDVGELLKNILKQKRRYEKFYLQLFNRTEKIIRKTSLPPLSENLLSHFEILSSPLLEITRSCDDLYRRIL